MYDDLPPEYGECLEGPWPGARLSVRCDQPMGHFPETLHSNPDGTLMWGAEKLSDPDAKVE